jgi:hypothetical protein
LAFYNGYKNGKNVSIAKFLQELGLWYGRGNK